MDISIQLMAKLDARMEKLLILAAILLAPLVAFNGQAEASCSVRLFRSPDQSTLMVRVHAGRYIYLSLLDSPEYPAIQFYVNQNWVTVFDKQAMVGMKTIESLQALRDPVSRQFQHYSAQFDQQVSAARLQGRQVRQHVFFRRDKFLIEWLPERTYRVYLEEIPGLSIRLKKNFLGLYHEIKSPLFDLETQINNDCQFRFYRQGVRVEQAQLDPMYQPLRSDGGWNPMDANSWTLFDRRNQQAGSSSGGFRFARPLEPMEPEDPDELEPLSGDTIQLPE